MLVCEMSCRQIKTWYSVDTEAQAEAIGMSQVIYQTRETVFHRDIQTPRIELKIRRAVFLTKFEVFE